MARARDFVFDAREVLFQAGDAAGFDGLGGAAWEEGVEAAPEVDNLVAGEPGDGWKGWCKQDFGTGGCNVM